MKKLKPIVHQLNTAETKDDQTALLKRLKEQMVKKDEEIAKLEAEINGKQKIIDDLNGLNDQQEFKLYKSNKRLDDTLGENHSLS